MTPPPFNLARAVAQHARYRPHLPAVVEEARTWSYRELDRAVRAVAQALRDRGAGVGTVVGVGLGECAEHLAALYAVARVGAVALPLDWRWSAEETARILRFFGARAALLEPQGWRALRDAGALDPAVAAATLVRPCAADGGETDGAAPLPGPDAGAETDADAADAPPVADAAELPLLLGLTSGTTGFPKGAVLTHGQMFMRFAAQWAHLSFHGEDVYLSATPLYHGGGRAFTMSHLYLGATVVLSAPRFDPERVLAEIARHRVTTLFVVPTMLQRLLDVPRLAEFDRSSLRVVISSGAALSGALKAEVLRRFSPHLYDYYGSTDGGGIAVLTPAGQHAHADTVGRPMLHTEVRIAAPDGSEAPAGTEGEVCLRGPAVTQGYYNNPEATAETLRDGWFHTGDLGTRTGAGHLRITGRLKDVIIRGGVNLYPGEIEAALATHPQVADAAVVGVPHEALGEVAVACLVLRGDATDESLAAHCAQRLARYKVPARFVRLEELPRNVNGKVLRDELRRRVADGGSAPS